MAERGAGKPKAGSVPRVGPAIDGAVREQQHGFIATLRHMLDRRVDRDGEAPELERLALAAGEDDGGSRRERGLGRPQEIIDRALSQKILHGWLQNRHQVLVPLTFRLNRLGSADAALLMRFAAAALLNASTADDAARRSLEGWLKGSGADDVRARCVPGRASGSGSARPAGRGRARRSPARAGFRPVRLCGRGRGRRPALSRGSALRRLHRGAVGVAGRCGALGRSQGAAVGAAGRPTGTSRPWPASGVTCSPGLPFTWRRGRLR